MHKLPKAAMAVPIRAEPIRNKLLASLDSKSLTRISDSLEVVELKTKEVLYRPEEHIKEVYFPDSAVLSLVTVMKNGQRIEAATVGREGASWISASFAAPAMPCETLVVIGGQAHKIGVPALQAEINSN